MGRARTDHHGQATVYPVQRKNGHLSGYKRRNDASDHTTMGYLCDEGLEYLGEERDSSRTAVSLKLCFHRAFAGEGEIVQESPLVRPALAVYESDPQAFRGRAERGMSLLQNEVDAQAAETQRTLGLKALRVGLAVSCDWGEATQAHYRKVNLESLRRHFPDLTEDDIYCVWEPLAFAHWVCYRSKAYANDPRFRKDHVLHVIDMGGHTTNVCTVWVTWGKGGLPRMFLVGKQKGE